MYKSFIDEVNTVIKREHFEYYSYGNGVALAYLMRTATCSDQMRDWLYSYIDQEYTEVVAMLKKYNLSDGDLDTWQNLMDLSTLDAIVELWQEWSDKEEHE